MLAKKEYYEIVIKDNNLAIVHKIDFDEYNYFKYNSEYVYYTKNKEKYPLDKVLSLGIDTLVVDGVHLYELLDDLIDQVFCNSVEFYFIDDYLNG